MIKFFSMLRPKGDPISDPCHEAVNWLRDPLQHPDLMRMEERELADLPFPGWPWPRTSADNTCDCR
ncbi:hypothetical protein A8M32_21555 [Sinorhizobium alkalisoli]|uniref:Uncharacterized protein n=1 Tax=Sinorhizobium alkalisoli TaxID=1752398 RepID=A0A1E3V691_9HYPH|nr:hypothetical protein A8M32_21555 [Sinorhizobium alkalisoli]QFI65458.1 hypothetical protein EKH55_0584 [Sinorhizobium alkalisoli]